MEQVSSVNLNGFPQGPSSYPAPCWLTSSGRRSRARAFTLRGAGKCHSVPAPPRHQVLRTHTTHLVFVGSSQGWGLVMGWIKGGRHCKLAHQLPFSRRWKTKKNHISQNPLCPGCRHRSSFLPTRPRCRSEQGSPSLVARWRGSSGLSLEPRAYAGSQGSSVVFLLEGSYHGVWLLFLAPHQAWLLVPPRNSVSHLADILSCIPFCLN